MNETVEIRAAAADDSEGIATVHVTSWQAAYRGPMPDDVLTGLSIQQRAEGWRHLLTDREPGSRTIVAERDGQIVGWASFGPGRDDGQADSGELWGLYALPTAYSTGVGHALITAVEAELAQAGFSSAYLWVLDGNERATSFYERHGWVADGSVKLDERPGMTLLEHRRAKRLV